MTINKSGLRRYGLILVVGLCLGILMIPAAYSQYQTKVYFDNGGDRINVADGGEFQVESGGLVDIQAGATVSIASGLSSSGNLVVSAPTGIATATPAVYINNAGVSDQIAIADGGVVAFQMYNGGGARFGAPTAIATAVPGVVVDSLGVSIILDVRDAATSVFAINNGGSITAAGAGTWASGQTVNNWAVVSAPTAIATATPAFVVDSLGVSNILEIRDAATPVFAINNNGGAIVAGGAADFASTVQYGADNLYPIGYASSGQAIVAGVTAEFTGTTTVASGLTTVLSAVCVPYGDATATAATCSADWSGATVTLRTWLADGATAGTTGQDVNYIIFGTK